MTRRLVRPTDPVFVRLELEPAVIPGLEDAAHACRLSLASFCRLAVELLTRDSKVSVDDVRKEADKRLAGDKPKGGKKK